MKNEIIDAAIQCEKLVLAIDLRTDKATMEDHDCGQYGNWRHDAEIMRMAALILRHETQRNDQVVCNRCGNAEQP